jgi:excisionase family DNA binding protein
MYSYNEDEQEEQREYEFMTPKEVMEELAIGRNQFYALASEGKIPAFRIGKQWRVKRADLMAWKPRR